MSRIYRRLAAATLAAAGLAACVSSPEPVNPLTVAVATPAPQCRSTGLETSADRIVRLHTETMVAGLSCGSLWHDAGAPGRYVKVADTIRIGDTEYRYQE